MNQLLQRLREIGNGYRGKEAQCQAYIDRGILTLQDKEVVREFFPDADYKQYKGEKAMIAGLGELKKNGRDPLFAINHTCAMLRANINRLFRRTWCTTKKPKRLEDHLAIYIAFHNSVLLS
jgi:hypothetical protein